MSQHLTHHVSRTTYKHIITSCTHVTLQVIACALPFGTEELCRKPGGPTPGARARPLGSRYEKDGVASRRIPFGIRAPSPNPQSPESIVITFIIV